MQSFKILFSAVLVTAVLLIPVGIMAAGGLGGSVPAGFTFTKNLSLGMSDLDVVKLKSALLSLSCYSALAEGTPYFGVNTQTAVICFQTKFKAEISAVAGYQISATGIFGTATRQVLNAKIAAARATGDLVNPLAPTATPSTDTYILPQSVTLTTTTAFRAQYPSSWSGTWSIRYTLNGTDPTCTTGTLYTGAIPVSSTKTIKAVSCVQSGSTYFPSPIGSFTYTFGNPKPTATPEPGTYNVSTGVMVNLYAPGATSIHYARNSSSVTCSTGTVYTSQIYLTSSDVINAVACYPSGQSATASFLYAINNPSASSRPAPTAIMYSGGWFSANNTCLAVLNVISPSTDVPNIYYTLDGSTPTCSSTRYYYDLTRLYVSPSQNLKAIACYSNGSSAVSSFQCALAPLAATPTASPEEGTFTSPQTVTLTAPGATSILYTVKGSADSNIAPQCPPFNGGLGIGTAYSAPITINSTNTINAIACYPDGNYSLVKQYTYQINPVEGCEPSWTCSDWGGCINRYNITFQEKTCVDARHCNIPYSDIAPNGDLPRGAYVGNCLGQKQITVISPNATTSCMQGQPCTVTWSSSRVSYVDIYLVKDGVAVLSLAQGFGAGNDSYTWTVPNTVAAGSYTIRMREHFTPGSISATGNSSPFAIVLSNTLPPQPNTPAVSATPIAGTYPSPQTVTLRGIDTTNIHYTTDGTRPTCYTGTAYTTPIYLNSSKTIQAVTCYPNINGALSPSQVVSLPYTITSSCAPNWTCGAWGSCVGGDESRACTDSNSCGVTSGRPALTRKCTTACVPNWTCGSWSTCVASSQSRTCTDSNICGVTTGRPALTQACVVTPSITVTSPNGGEQWMPGSTHNITWTSVGLSSLSMSAIMLQKTETSGSNINSTSVFIAPSVLSNSGSYSWTIPSSVGTGTQYKVQVYEIGSSFMYADFSDNYFSIVTTATCAPNWSCAVWGSCVAGQQTRTCTDSNSCGVTTGRPALTQACSTTCTPSWSCGAWGNCAGGQQARSCTDSNNCGVTTGRPALTQACTCTPSWSCANWSSCSYGSQGRTCADTNNCGTTTGRPPLTQICGTTCTPNWTCGAWANCAGGQQARSCTDSNNCGVTTGRPALTQACTCTPNWTCGSWGSCTGGSQSRTCSDSNGCGVMTGRPAITQTCSTTCTPSWTCGAWGSCTGGSQSRTCTDSSACGTTTGRPALTQTCSATGSIVVTSPNGLEEWVQGSTHNVTWTATGLPISANVGILFWNISTSGNNSYTTIAASVPANSGSRSWTIPSTLQVGSRYKVQVYGLAPNSAYSDFSNNYLSIVSAPTCTSNWTCGSWSSCTAGQQTRTCTDSNNCGTTAGRPALTQTCTPTGPYISVTAPSSAASCTQGMACNITWNSSGISQVNISLVFNGTTVGTIASNVPASPNSYSWIVPGGILSSDVAGSLYTMKVATASGSLVGTSNFSILASSPGTTIPQGPVNVTLDPTTPASQNLSAGQNNVSLVKVKLINPTIVGIAGLNSFQVGFASGNVSNKLTNVKIYEGNVQVSAATAPVVAGDLLWVNLNGSITIPPNSSRTFTLVADVKSTAPAGSMALGVTALNFYTGVGTATSMTGIPVYGNNMTIAGSTAGIIQGVWDWASGLFGQ